MPPHLPIRPQSSPTPTQLEVPQQNIEPLHGIHLRRGNSSRVLPTSAIHPSKGEIRLKRTKLKKNLPGVTPPLLICPNQNLLKVAPSCKDRVQVNGGGPGRAPLHQVQDRKKKMDLTEHFPLLPFPALPIKGAEKGRSMKGKI